MSSALARLRRILAKSFEALAPEDTLAHPALPLTLLLRPVPVLALVLLVLNDHVLKASGVVPNAITGKLSDFAGLLFFPLLLVTLLNLLVTFFAWVRKRPLRWQSPSTTQVVTACVATGLFFSAVQLVPAVADFYARATAVLSVWSDAPLAAVTMDPTDLLALVVLFGSDALGRRAIRKLPPGRLAPARNVARGADSVANKRRALEALFADVQSTSRGQRDAVSDLISNIATDADDAAIDACLVRIRAPE